MRRSYYLVFILLLIAQTSFGQIYQNMAQPGYKFSRARFDSVLTIPTGLGGLRNITGGQDTGQIRFNVSDSSVYVWNGRGWIKPVGGGVSDTLKVSVSDTAAMLLPYARVSALAGYQPLNSLSLSNVLAVGNDGNGNAITNIADPTSEMDATTKKYVDSEDARKLYLTDTASMLSAYAKTAAVNLKVNISDTAAMLKPYLDTLQAHNTRIIAAGGAAVTVSSYGKNATRDSTILLLSNGTRYAAKDSVGGGAASQWVDNANGINYNSGNVGIGASLPTAKLNLRSDFSGVGDSSKGVIIINETAATSGNPSSSPPIRLEGRSFISTGAGSVRSVYNLTNITGSSPTGSSTLAFTHSLNNSVPSTLFSINPNTGLFALGTANIAGNIIGSEVWTSNGRVRINANGDRFNADFFSYNNNANQQNPGTNTGNYITHDFKGGITTTTTTATANHIFANFGGNENWSTLSAATWEGMRINITETSNPTGQKYLFRAGKGGGSFTSLFDITNTGQVMVGTATPNASAALNVTSTTQGFLMPRMTAAQRNAIATPAAGLQVIVTGETGGEFVSMYNSSLAAWQKSSSNWVTTGSNIYYNTGNVGIGTTTPESKLTIRTDALGSTPDSSAGLILVNKTAAALGLPQYSPFVTFEGRAWNTVSGNSRLRFRMGVIPAQSNPTSGTFVIQSGINDAAFSTVASINQGGTLTLSNALLVAGISTFSQDVSVNANTNTFRLNATNEITNTASVANNTSRNVFQSTAVINTTGGTQTIRGFYYNPTNTNLTGTTSIGFQNTTGNNFFGSTSGSTSIGAGTTIAPSAILDIKSTTQGVLFPRMTTAEKTAIASPAAGLQVYDTTLNQMSYYNGTTWVNF